VWTLEGPSPSLLSLEGITAKTINPGDQLVLTIDPLRTGASGGSWSPNKTWCFKDGRRAWRAERGPLSGSGRQAKSTAVMQPRGVHRGATADASPM
jgi:hypothetical protein